MTWQNLFLPSFLWQSGDLKIYFISFFSKQPIQPFIKPLTSCPSAMQLRPRSQCLSRQPFYHQTQSVTRTWLEVMTGRSFNVELSEIGKESFDSWLYGSIVNNPVDPWWRSVTWVFIILEVRLSDQFPKIGSWLKSQQRWNMQRLFKAAPIFKLPIDQMIICHVKRVCFPVPWWNIKQLKDKYFP